VTGEVIDEEGRPVPGAEVRLADRGVSAGRDIRAWTDQSGRFTLTGLRPGESYTLIAETEDGSSVGRSKVEAPHSGVEIRMASSRRTSPRTAATDVDADPAPERRIRSISNVREPGARINLDDVPAASPDEFEEEQMLGPSSGRSNRGKRSGWRAASDPPGGSGSQRSSREEDLFMERSASISRDHGSLDHESEFHELRAPANAAVNTVAPDPEGVNPLPPAREAATASTTSESRTVNAQPEPGALMTADRGSAESEAQASEHGVESSALAHEFRPEEQGPPALEGELSAHSSFDEVNPASTPQPVSPVASSSGVSAPAGALVNDALPVPIRTEDLPPRAKPTWSELALRGQGQGQRPGNAVIDPSQSAPGATTAASGTMVFPISTRPRISARSRSEALAYRSKDAREPERSSKSLTTQVQFDAKKRRIVDFQLADLEGRPVRFQDLDADFILLDFWGSWCAPCRASIPHLVELQNQYDPRRLKVVGIAYEQGEPMERVRRAVAATQEFGINYPVLLAEQDGQPCPLQNALQVDVFPTLLLIDRHGRILWRDKGANPLTLARLDKAIAAQISSDTVRR
jgi:thiol-disulfide isomerase/thioredoxin